MWSDETTETKLINTKSLSLKLVINREARKDCQIWLKFETDLLSKHVRFQMLAGDARRARFAIKKLDIILTTYLLG